MDRNVEIDPNCPVHGKPHGHEHTLGLAAKVRIGQLERLILATDERAKRAEAEVRAKDETIGELLDLVYHGLDGTLYLPPRRPRPRKPAPDYEWA
jgi:hypothetical protein